MGKSASAREEESTRQPTRTSERTDHPAIVNEMVAYNKHLLSEFYFDRCTSNPFHPSCEKVGSNTLHNWRRYFNQPENQFSKGIERLNRWMDLSNSPGLLRIQRENADKFHFIMASLIIIWQVFGDGNHRTASHYYHQTTGKSMTMDFQEVFINPLIGDYEFITSAYDDTRIAEMIGKISQIYHEVQYYQRYGRGGRREKSKKGYRRRHSRKRRSRRKNV